MQKICQLFRKEFHQNKINEFLKDIKSKKVLVLGEIHTDEYITTEAIGKSGKEPMMVVQQKKKLSSLEGWVI